MEKSQGFTLIELLVTITVLAIITTLATPTFKDIMLKQDFNKSTQELIFTLNQARSKAVLERRVVTVNLNNTVPTANTANQFNWMPTGKSILKSSGSATTIVFGLTGGVFVVNPSDPTKWVPAAGTTTFIICNKGGTDSDRKSKTISVSRMGTIQQVTEGTC